MKFLALIQFLKKVVTVLLKKRKVNAPLQNKLMHFFINVSVWGSQSYSKAIVKKQQQMVSNTCVV